MTYKYSPYFLLSCMILFFTEVSVSEEQIPTDVFGSPPLIADVKISPSGEKIAVYATLGNGDSAILVRDLSKNEPLRPIVSSDNKTLKLTGFSWFNEETILSRAWFAADYYSTKIDLTRLVKIIVDGSGFKTLFKKRHFKELPDNFPQRSSIIDYLLNDDDHILVQIRTSNYRYPDVVKLNVDKNSIQMVQKAKTHVRSWRTDKEGRVRVGNKYERDQEITSAILFKDLNTNKYRTIWKFANLSED